MTKDLFTIPFETVEIVSNLDRTHETKVINVGELAHIDRVFVEYLPPLTFKQRAFTSLISSLDTLQQSGKAASDRLGLKTDEDVFRYLSET